MWTTDPPKVVGYYWWRLDEKYEPEPIRIFQDGSTLLAGWDEQDRFDVAEIGGEFLGPITPEDSELLAGYVAEAETFSDCGYPYRCDIERAFELLRHITKREKVTP